ncbi:MAG: CAP domain-containing protein [Lachnospiraceae bacterium]|nr:CAP domain-containing protein [Lachnospiraceae bacterium]
MKRMSRLIMALAMIMVLSPVVNVKAANNKEITGKVRYDYAFKVLELVNKERASAGVPSVEMDASLLETAMARAAETTVSFDHTRPNGESCFSLNKKMFGENIAWGQRNPTAVMNAWMNSQGHKENILDKSYNSIGIGCMELNGSFYWVQCFGFDKAESVKEPASGNATYQVALNTSGETKLLKGVESKEETTEKSTEQKKTDNTSEDTDDGAVAKPSKVAGVKVVRGKKKLTLVWKKANVDGYQIQISAKKNYKKADTYNIASTGKKMVIKKYKNKKLKSNKKYYVRIRAFSYSENEILYGAWKKASAKTK